MILFTADWHLKLGQKNVPHLWAMERYQTFFENVHDLEDEVDLHIIGGDLFDRLPTMPELQLYFEFISNASVETIIFDGNHEATRKNKTFFSNLKEATEKINPLVQIVDSLYETETFTILPYCELHRKTVFNEIDKSKPLFTHVRGEIPPHVKPEIDLDLLAPFPVVFAGDLHAHSNTQRNIVYPGSPMTTSFHRDIVKTGYLQILTPGYWEWKEFDLPQLLRRTITSEDDEYYYDSNSSVEVLKDNNEFYEVKDMPNLWIQFNKDWIKLLQRSFR